MSSIVTATHRPDDPADSAGHDAYRPLAHDVARATRMDALETEA